MPCWVGCAGVVVVFCFFFFFFLVAVVVALLLLLLLLLSLRPPSVGAVASGGAPGFWGGFRRAVCLLRGMVMSLLD